MHYIILIYWWSFCILELNLTYFLSKTKFLKINNYLRETTHISEINDSFTVDWRLKIILIIFIKYDRVRFGSKSLKIHSSLYRILITDMSLDSHKITISNFLLLDVKMSELVQSNWKLDSKISHRLENWQKNSLLIREVQKEMATWAILEGEKWWKSLKILHLIYKRVKFQSQ